MPATVIAQRIGWPYSAGYLRERVAGLRPIYKKLDPANRTLYVRGGIVQCVLWFPGKKVPDSSGSL